jgi:hypothetical protein
MALRALQFGASNEACADIARNIGIQHISYDFYHTKIPK